jgi:Core-2/I-Branching enzyme
VCLAVESPEDINTADIIEESSSSLRLRPHNDTAVFSALFQVRSCPSRCIAIQQEQQQTDSNLRRKVGNNGDVRIFYLILIHNQRSANDAVYLFRAIRDPRNIIVIHFDKKVEHLLRPQQDNNNDDNDDTTTTSSPPLTLLQEIESCSCGSNVIVDSVHSVEWSKWSMNLPTLWGMGIAASSQYEQEWDVFINLSGDTMPIYTTNTMATILQNLSYNFVTSRSCETGLIPTNVYTFPKYWHKRRHYTMDDTEPDPIFTYRKGSDNTIRNKTIVTHFGSQWIIVQNSFVTWLMEQLQDNDSWPSQYRDYLAESGKLMTDETFIPSVLMHINEGNDDIHPNLPKIHTKAYRLLWNNGTLSHIYHMRYERMDEHYPTSYGKFPRLQHYKVPKSYIRQNLLDQPKTWGPYFLGIYDMGQIRTSGALFARKISAILDFNMVQLLPVNRTEDIPNIHWPVEVSFIDRPDWRLEKEIWDELHSMKHDNQYEPQQRILEEESNSNNGSSDDDEEL